MADTPNLDQIIELMNKALTDNSFKQLVFVSFKPVKNQFKPDDALFDKILKLVEYVDTNREIFKLLTKIEKINVKVFGEYERKILQSKQSQIKYQRYKAINQLIEYLQKYLDLDQLQSIYSYCRPNQADKTVTDIEKMVTQLDRPFQTYSPLIKFVVQVKEQFAELNQSLENWLSQYGDLFGYAKFQNITSIPHPSLPVESSESSLLIIINQQKNKLDCLELQAWLWVSEQNIHPLSINKKDSIIINVDSSGHHQHYQEISAVLTELIENSNRFLEGNSQSLRIDFFLPINLLSREDFKIEFINFQDREGMNMKIGEMYPVVFRLINILGSLYNGGLKQRWEEHWSQLKGQNLNDLIQSSLFEESNCTFKANESHTICLGYKKLSEADCRKALNHVYKRIIPVFIWVRNSFKDEMCIKNIQNIFEALDRKDIPDKIKQLPLEIQEQRVIALDEEIFNNNKEHIGHHICLLWNAPERMPPDPQKPENALMAF